MTDHAHTIKVVFQPEGRVIHVLPGTSIIEAAGRADIVLETPCGGKGHCGKCRVQVVSGCPEPTEADRKAFTPEQLGAGMRLACQNHLTEPATVEIPQDARFFGQKILVEGVKRHVHLNPNFRKVFARVPEPSLEDQRSDLDRLKSCLLELTPAPVARLPMIRALPGLLHLHENEFTVVLENDEIVAVEEGNTMASCYGVAVDIGTTTIVGLLVDLTTGEEMATASRMNPQVARGDDVITRLTFITEQPQGLDELHRRVVDCINDIIAELCRTSGVPAESIYELTAVGNTTMNHIFLKVDPRKIAQAPFAAVLREAVNAKAADMGIRINPLGNVYACPNIAGFVGGDTVGVILATGMLHGDAARLAIDIGTNGELVLAAGGRVICCSTAAGPAFEGARIRHGMRAALGAIDKVVFNNSVEVTTIGDAAPRGICGTGLIDAVAEMVRTGVVDYTGRIIDPDEAPLPDFAKRRIVSSDGSKEFVLIDAADTQTGQPIILTQRDVREVQLAKGAMRAGIEIMLTELWLTANDLHEVYLAGAFGNFIRRSMAKRLGLLPDIPTERIKFVGNAACTGAKMVLAAREYRDEADRISSQVRYVELAGRPDFQHQFMTAMLFPGSA